MPIVVSSLYTAALTLFLVSASLLRAREVSGTRHISWLTWFLVVEAGTFLLEVLMAHPSVPLKGLWLGLRMGSALLIAPCLWLAIKETATGTRPRFREVGKWHVAGVAVGLVLAVPLIEDAHWGVDYVDPTRPVGWLQARFIHVTMLGCIAIFAVQAPILLHRCRLLLKPSLTNAEAPAWLRFLLPVVGVTWALGLLRTVQGATHVLPEFLLLAAILEATVAVGSIYILIRRFTFSPPVAPAPAVPASEIEEFQPAPPKAAEVLAPIPLPAPSPSATEVTERYARSRITPVVRERIRRKLAQRFTRERLHRDSALTLRSLAETLKENEHYLSQVLNQDLDSSFYDFVNKHRIEDAKGLLLSAPDQSILDVAFAVGFNSKSTFNTAFRVVTGVTPRDFRTGKAGEGEVPQS